MEDCAERIEDDDNTTSEEPRMKTRTCIICHDDFPRSEMHSCIDDVDNTSDTNHFMCSDCFLGYANVELAGGAFEGIRYFGGNSSSTLVSSPGNLPCPKFVTGDCETAAISLTTLFGAFHASSETAKLYYLASRRIVYQEAEQDRQLDALEAQVTESPTDGDIGNEVLQAAIENIKLRVQAALCKGAVVKCPQCHQPGIKNSHCIHIRCHLCATSWCYCCGRTRESLANPVIRCRGCDAFDSRLEMQQPNWNSFAIGTESAAYGALHEFHRQRQAYFVQDVKLSTIPYQWLAFQATYPIILNDVPTPGRFIKWEELDTTIEPPVFGNSQASDLLWALHPRFNPANAAQDNNEDTTAQANAAETLPQTVLVPLSQVFRTHRGLGWIFLLLTTIWVFATGIFFDLLSKDYWAAAAIFLSLNLFYHTALFLLLRMADYFELHPDSWVARYIPEVLFVGRRRHAADGEGPYLSASGRWRRDRRIRVGRPLFGLTLGLILFSISLLTASTFMGAMALLILVPVCSTALLQATILNLKPLPPLLENQQPRPVAFSQLMGGLLVFQVLTGIGAAFLFSEVDSSPSATGIFFVMFGIGLTIATLLPRLFSEQFYFPRPRAMDQSRSFWIGLVVFVYCLWIYFFFSSGEAVGALIVGPILLCHCWLSALSPQPGAVEAGVEAAADVEPDVEEGMEHDLEAGVEPDPDIDHDIELVAEPTEEADAEPEIEIFAESGVGDIDEDDVELVPVTSAEF